MAPNRTAVHNGRTTTKKVADDELEFDLTDLRIREITEIETLTGKPFGEFADALQGKTSPWGELLQIIGYIIKKRDNPDFTMEMALDLKVNMDPTTAVSRKR